MEPETQKAAEHVASLFGLPGGTVAALVVLGMAAQPFVRRLAFLIPTVRTLFAPEGYEQLRREVETMATAVQKLTGAVDALVTRVKGLEDRNAAHDRAQEIDAEVERRMRERLGEADLAPG